jgi:metal transporter CNNM
MAIVVANAKHDPTCKTEIPPSVLHDPAEFSTMRWTATERTNKNIISNMKRIARKPDSNNDILASARANAAHTSYQQNAYGIRAPRPVGIITFEDIINAILQKTSHDEKDFFGMANHVPPPKIQKPSGVTTQITPRDSSPLGHIYPIYMPKSRSQKASPKNSTLRFRTNSKARDAINNLDGTYENDYEGAFRTGMEGQKMVIDRESSYTDNSSGGFHGANNSTTSFQPTRLTAAEISDFIAFTPTNPYSPPRATSLPSRKSQLKDNMRRYVSASPVLPANSCVTDSSVFDNTNDTDGKVSHFVMPNTATESQAYDRVLSNTDSEEAPTFFSCSQAVGQHDAGESEETILTLSSWCGNYYDHEPNFDSTTLYDALPVTMQRMQDQDFSCRDLETISEERSNRGSENLADGIFKPYHGFPAELLDRSDENRVLNYASLTLPRMPGPLENDDSLDEYRDLTPVGEKSFEDDRALLPSQRKALQANLEVTNPRCTSLWF